MGTDVSSLSRSYADVASGNTCHTVVSVWEKEESMWTYYPGQWALRARHWLTVERQYFNVWS